MASKCTIENCDKKINGKGLCNKHYKQSRKNKTNEEARLKLKENKEFAEKRREQKKLAQRTYVNKTRAYLKLKNRAKREKKQILFSFEEFLLIKKDICSICECGIDITSHGLGLIDPLKDYTETNVFSVCAKCIKNKNKSFNINSFCKKILRKYSRRNPAFTIAKDRARISRGLYLCHYCKEKFTVHNIEVDHKIPVTPLDNDNMSLDEYANRLYCSADNLQVLCKPCHLAKTTIENATRVEIRKKNKA